MQEQTKQISLENNNKYYFHILDFGDFKHIQLSYSINQQKGTVLLMDGNVKKFVKNEYIFSIVSKFVNMGMSLLQSILVARYLGAALKGSNAYITSIVSVGAIIITFGMHQAYPYMRKKYGRDAIYDKYLSLMTCVFSLYMVIAIIVSIFLKSSDLKVACLLLPVAGYSAVLSYVALIESPNKQNARHLIVVGLDLSCIFLLYIFTESNYAWSIVVLSLLYVLQLIVYSRMLRFKFTWNKSMLPFLKELYSFGFFPMLALLMTTLNYKIDVLMLRQYPAIITAAQVGVYSVGMSITDRIALIPDTLKGVMVSKLAKGAEEKEVAKVCRLCFLCSILICVGLLVVGQPLIDFLYGKEYTDAYQVLLICAFGTIFIGYFKLIAQYNIINKRQIRNVIMLSVSVLINAILNIILIPRYQLAGAAFASGIGYFVSGIVFVVWFAKNSGIKLTEMFIVQKEDFALFKSLFNKKNY